jgi:sulfur carrier protein ThiS
MWSDKYIGVPYKPNGRDETGLDCWGLAHLVYKEQFNIDLPSFSEQYDIDDDARIKDLISQYEEGWELVETPSEGNLVLFKIFGELTHIGVMVNSTEFIHVRENSNTVKDNVENTKWKNRAVGFYKYSKNTGVVLNAVPHPLKTERITVVIPEGMTLEEVYKKVNLDQKISPDLLKTVNIIVNGIVVPRTAWQTTVLKPTDVVEYRAVPGKEVVKMIAIIVIAIYAPQILFQLGAPGIAAGAAAGTFVVSGVGHLLVASVVMVGSALINAIAPVRPPPPAEDPGTPEAQLMVSGGANPYTPYGAIPVVLGKVRLTPPLGAKSFVRFANDGVINYLNMMLVWGYGPLEVDQTTIKVGEVDWDEYVYDTAQGGGRVTLDYRTTPTATELSNFKLLYGNDVTQLSSGIQMTGPARSSIPEGSNFGETSSGDMYRRSPGGFGNITVDLNTGGTYSPPIVQADDIFELAGG